MSRPNPAAVARGRAGGLAAARKLTKEQLSERARPGGEARRRAHRERLLAQLADPAVQEWLASMPPLSDERRAALAALLKPSASRADVVA